MIVDLTFCLSEATFRVERNPTSLILIERGAWGASASIGNRTNPRRLVAVEPSLASIVCSETLLIPANYDNLRCICGHIGD